MKPSLLFVIMGLLMSASAFGELFNITSQQLPFTAQSNFTFISPSNTTLTYVCSSYITACPSQEIGDGVVTKTVPLTVPLGTAVGTYEHFILVSSNNLTYQHNITVSVAAYTGITENNFSLNVTLSDTLSDYFLVQLYGPDGTQVSFTVSEIGKQGISGSKIIGDNGVHGMYQFFHQPFNNGQYKAVADFTYNGNTFHKEFPFTVDIFKALSFTLNISNGPYIRGQTIQFQALMSSFEDPVSFSWDLNGDGTIDSTTANTSYFYAAKGQYKVNLTVSDKTSTQSKIVTLSVIEPPVAFLARASLQDVQITLGPMTQSTNASGETVFNITPGEYTLRAQKSGYDNLSALVNVTSDMTYSFSLQGLVFAPLPTALGLDEISLVSPNETTLDFVNPLALRFEVSDAFVQECILQMDGVALATFSSIAPNTRYSYDWAQPKVGTHELIISCKDFFNATQSKKHSFTITSKNSERIYKEKEIGEQVYALFNDAIIGLRGMNSEQAKMVISHLDLEDSVYKNRDELSSILAQYDKIDPTLEESYLEKELTTLSAKVVLLKEETIVNLTILDSSEFVYLPSAKDITEVAQRFAQRSAPEDFSMEKYIKEALRQKTSISTHVHLVELQKGDSKKEYVTFIQRIVQKQGNGTYVEILPQQFVDDPEGVVLLDTTAQILEYSPSMLLSAQEETTMTYYVKKQLFTTDVERFPAAILPDVKKNTSAIVAFLPLGIGSLLFIIAGAGMFALHKKDVLLSPRRLYKFAKAKISALKKNPAKLSAQQMSVIVQVIDQILVLASAGQEEKSAQLYAQMEGLYTKVADPAQKALINERLHSLRHQLIILHIRNSMQKALQSATSHVFHEAKSLYEEVLGLYMSLPSHHQAQLQQEVLMLKERITSLYQQGSSKLI